MPAYEIYAAFSDEANDGWIWQARYSTRTIVTISRKHNGCKLKVFCAVRQFDPNFIHRYNDGAYARKDNETHSRGQRYKIDNEAISLVMNEWYRKHCLGMAATEHRPNGLVSLDIREAKRGWFPGTWFPGIRAACQQPDLAIRLGTRLGVLGGWLGVSGLLFGLIALIHPYLGEKTPTAAELIQQGPSAELILIAVVAVFSLLAGILSIRICRPPKPASGEW
jgi:hypothetical protein